MSQIILGKSAERDITLDLGTLITTRLLIQANSGQGKSWLLRRIAEQCHGKLPVIIIDPEGEFATLREKFGYVLVGQGGETPADVRSASLLAEKLLELRASAVCDLFEPFRKNPQGRHEWVKRFIEAMLDAPKSLWRPTLVIVDEAHWFCPEKGDSVAAQAMVGLCTAGRKRGFCAVWATQRLALVKKDASAMLSNRLVGGTFEDVDVERACELLSVSKEDRLEFKRKIRVLEPGSFFALGRAISKERILFRAGTVETTHPEIGPGKHVPEPPPAPEAIKLLLPKLAELPKAAEEKARTEAELRAEIRSLKAQLKSAPKETVKVKVADEKEIRRVASDLQSKWILEVRRRDQLLRSILKSLQPIKQLAETELPTLEVPEPEIPEKSRSIPSISPLPEMQRMSSMPSIPAMAPMNGNGDLSGPQKKILTALAQLLAIGKTQPPREMVAGWAGYSPNGGGFLNPLGSLRSSGYIDYPASGSVCLTERGIEAAGPQEPPSLELIQQRICGVCSGPERKILSVLLENGPDELPREELAARAGYEAKGGGFLNPLGALRTKGFLDYPRSGFVRPAEWLFEG